jgi:hypothetical protein
MDGHHGREKRRLLQSRRFLLRAPPDPAMVGEDEGDDED